MLIKRNSKELSSLTPHLLSNQIEPIDRLKGHLNSIESISLNPANLNQLVSGCHDKTLKLWDLTNRSCTQTLEGHKEGIWTCQFSPDGNQILSGSPDFSVMIWDPKSGKPIKTIQEHDNKVYWAKFNENGSFYASGGADQNIVIYDVKAGKVLQKIPTDSKIIYAVEFSKDGQFICTCDIQGEIKLYDQKTFELIDQTKSFHQYLYDYNEEYQKVEIESENRAFTLDLDFSSQSKSKNKIFVGFQDGFLRCFDYKKESKEIVLEKEFQAHTDAIKNVVIDAKKSGIIATSSRDGGTRIWNSSLEFQSLLIGHTDNVSSCALDTTTGGSLNVYTGSWDQTINIYKC